MSEPCIDPARWRCWLLAQRYASEWLSWYRIENPGAMLDEFAMEVFENAWYKST